MLLTITTTHRPATDLGFLLHKNPARLQAFDLSFGRAHVFYPAASYEACTAALLLEVDPVGLVRNRRGPAGEGFALEQYVNDRPYVASSFLSVALAQVFGSALAGTSRERPELAQTPIPLTARISVLPCRGGEGLLHRLFEPLGYRVTATRHALDERFPEWGESPYYAVELAHTVTLRDLLAHLYVLVPVLDDDKHYWIGDDEVDKLLRHGERWLAAHPEREQVGPPSRRPGGPGELEDLTGRGGEGMVVKPLDFVVRGRKGLVQPAVKCRGGEYLRIIHGAEYDAPANLERLRKRSVGAKRSLALREFALGVEGLERFVRREPLRRVHECVFGVLALESEPVDPRL